MELNRQELTSTLEELFAPALKALGLSLWGLELGTAHGGQVVRVYVEKEGGVELDECAEASRHLSAILDVEDPVPGSFSLEVSSPGLERPFFSPGQLADHVGGTVEMKLAEPLPGEGDRKKYTGPVRAVEDEAIRLEADGRELVIPWSLVKSCRLKIQDWDALTRGKQH
ncbi:ribosome maturation factor RimP [Desulfohalovibrio reitneri]|uniref:ribosome maturation factor RimP n=1 Tax=Desulfohalovibrio reitneri TaxID=1307759 RepID=UPI0004A7546B|nr:ribosome maturation factor RimP [Desulfohalovibrio reitneri]